MEEKEKCCLTCMHEYLPQGTDPCNKCICHDEWKPKEGDPGAPAEGMVWPPVAGIDPGAPEGNKTNVRLDWGESGPELIVPPVMTEAKKIGYAIDGIRDHMKHIGLLFTDYSLSADALADMVSELQTLNRDLKQLEEEREALRKTG